jgi:hypothetical protein
MKGGSGDSEALATLPTAPGLPMTQSLLWARDTQALPLPPTGWSHVGIITLHSLLPE